MQMKKPNNVRNAMDANFVSAICLQIASLLNLLRNK